MSGSYSARLRAGGGLGATTVLAAKVAFASAALAAAASLARVAVPQIVSGTDGFLWKLYLFVTVHVIIFVIWTLSDNKHFHAPAQKDPWAPTPHHPAPPPLTEQAVHSAVKRKVELSSAADVVRGEELRLTRPHGAAAIAALAADEYRVPPQVLRPQIEAVASKVEEGVLSPGSCGGESCVTTESDEYAAAASVDTWRNVEPAQSPALKRAVVERGFSLPPPQTMPASDEHLDDSEDHDGGGDDDDLDATWNAIMQKTRPSTAPASSPSSAPAAPRCSPPRQRAREPSVGAAELSKRSEDFIIKTHNSLGRHQ